MKSLFLVPMVAMLSYVLFQNTVINHQPPAADSLEVYVGTYNFKDSNIFSTYTITLKEGALYGEADSYGPNKLIKKEKPDVFQSTSQYGSIITFKRNADTKKITGLSLFIQETEMNAERQ